MQEEGGRLQAEERGLQGNQPCQHLDLRLLASRTMRRHISVVYVTSSVALFLRQPKQTHTDSFTHFPICKTLAWPEAIFMSQYIGSNTQPCPCQLMPETPTAWLKKEI